jgi:predicted transcriptional regulator
MKTTKNQTGKKTLKDCTLKGMVLRAVASGGNNCTSRQIFNQIEYKNYNSLRVSINRYVKQGYLKKHEDKKPYYYSLTKKGMEHAKDPLILKKKRNFLYWKHVSQILANEKEFMHGVMKFIQHDPEFALREICKSPYFRGDSTFHGMYKKMLDEQNREIRDLGEILHRLGY